MFGFGKKVEPVKVIIPRDDFSLEEVIEKLSDQNLHCYQPFSDDIQSLLVQLGSDFKIVNRDNGTAGTNINRATLLCVALLLKKMKQQ